MKNETFPLNWASVELGQVASFVGGSQPPKSDFIYEPKDGYVRLIQIRDYKTEQFKTFVRKDSTDKICDENDVMIGRYGPPVFQILKGLKGAYNVALMKAVPDENALDRVYLFNLLQETSIQNTIIQASSRTVGQSGVSRELLESYVIGLPPLNEQKRIVAKLDAIFARTRAARERLAKIPALLEKLKQSVLAAAFRGDLTKDWREKNPNVEPWIPAKLKDLCLSIADGDHQAPPQAESGIPFITISAINTGTLNLEKATRFVPEQYFESLKSDRKAKKGDILFSVTGTIGVPAMVDTESRFVFQRHIAVLRPNLSLITQKFMFYRLMSHDIKQQGRLVATGTAQVTIPLGGLRNFAFDLPSLFEQKKIVQRVESMFAYAEALSIKQANLSELLEQENKSGLAKAFRGELVPQDPSDEPASVLLERIRAERQATEAQGKRKPRTTKADSNPKTTERFDKPFGGLRASLNASPGAQETMTTASQKMKEPGWIPASAGMTEGNAGMTNGVARDARTVYETTPEGPDHEKQAQHREALRQLAEKAQKSKENARPEPLKLMPTEPKKRGRPPKA